MAIDGIGGGMPMPPPPKPKGGAPAAEPPADKGAEGAAFQLPDSAGFTEAAPVSEGEFTSGGEYDGDIETFGQELETALEEAGFGGDDGKGGQIDVMA